jgi:AraC family ethanolamine operon transcriptional activator
MLYTEYCNVASYENADDHALGLAYLDQQYLQTGPGRFDGLLQQFMLEDGVHVYRERVNVPTLQEGAMSPGWRLFGISLLPERNATLQGRAVGCTIGHIAGGQGFVAQTASPSDYVGVVVGDETFAGCADYLGGLDMLPWTSQPLLEVSHAALRTAVIGVYDCLQAAEANLAALEFASARKAFRDDVLEHLLCLLIEAAPPRRRNDVTRLTYSDIVNRSRQHLLSDPNQPVSVLDLCQLLRVSRRTLQTSFLEVTGVTPSVYLRAVRLSLVRRLLRQTSASRLCINDAAARWGFIHMGKFAAEYRHMFGYLPSQTERAS